MADEDDERDEELSSIAAIFPELLLDPHQSHTATLDLDVCPTTPLQADWLRLDSCIDGEDIKSVEGTTTLQHLPPLAMRIYLPDGYPDVKPPTVSLMTTPEWLPNDVVARLELAVGELWEDYGRSQIVFAYIDMLQSEAEAAFGSASPLQLPLHLKRALIEFNDDKNRRVFEQGSYHCSICLDPKPGTVCHRMRDCGHIFCRECLQDFYSTAITQGEVDTVKCIDPDCGKAGLTVEQRRALRNRTLHPRELLAIPMATLDVQRYVKLKLKKKVESDKTTVYCPRQWCQGPARSDKYAKFLANADDLANYPDSDSEDESTVPAATTIGDNRLAICSTCAYAFCRNCHRSWHGEHIICRKRLAKDQISAEDKASEDWIRKYTSPCPTCDTPCQKRFGCNHMRCSQCDSHFCYLCSAWLKPGNPYQHFNEKGRACFMRLWDLEEGDRGDENERVVEFGGARGFEIDHAAAGVGVPGQGPVPAAAQEVAAREAAGQAEQRGLQRFLELARNDEEDGWDSDGLEDEFADHVVLIERAR
ncbi:hypothetical protein FH972_024875 [Carpinus fangiana]|uniref:RBR-type E3 ubiquitin transferase n=1 Tax=Carpinus fangiana TaxID=176857 RepID=A0A5N6L1V6_9ROSI|nr:hypothetical protein FH972_024875 [Carpinus fangiana]